MVRMRSSGRTGGFKGTECRTWRPSSICASHDESEIPGRCLTHYRAAPWPGTSGRTWTMTRSGNFLPSGKEYTVQLVPGEQDVTRWAWEDKGCYTASSAYASKFWGRQVAPYAAFVWKSKAPLQCRFFSWLAAQNRCWTSDRHARRGLPHQATYPFCDQGDETLNHILLTCVLA